MSINVFNGALQGDIVFEVAPTSGNPASGRLGPREASRPIEGEPPFNVKVTTNCAPVAVWEKFDVADGTIVAIGLGTFE